jgi:DNA polymerase-3 subunit delta'
MRRVGVGRRRRPTGRRCRAARLDRRTGARLPVRRAVGLDEHDAARAFAALLLTGVDDPASRAARLALRGQHPDVHEVERIGPFISAEQAREIIHVTSLAPVESARKVVVLHDFHRLTAEAAARLLKPIEEPPPSTTFLVLADFVPPELITIASRCARSSSGRSRRP